MTIENQRGQIGYGQYMDAFVEGQPTADTKGETKVNPNRPQISTYVVGGTPTAGAYTATATDPNSGIVSSVTFTRAAENDAATAAAIAALINASAAWRNVGTAVSDGVDKVTVAFDVPGRLYNITTAAPAPGTLVGATTQAAGGTALPFGRFLVRDTTVLDGVGLPSAVAATALIGVSIRSIGEAVNLGSPLFAAVDGLDAGGLVASAIAGPIALRNNSPAAVAQPHGSIFVVVNVAGGQNLGEARADDDGANSVELDVQRGYWLDTVQPGEVGLAWLKM